MKRLEGSDDSNDSMTADGVARAMMDGLRYGKLLITSDFQTKLLLNNM